MVILQGDLVWVRFPPPRGSEPAGRRPAVVIQGNAFNRSRMNTLVVAAITSNLKYEGIPGAIRLAKGEAGIPKPSLVNVTQIHSIDRTFVESKIGTLSEQKLTKVLEELRLVLDL